MAISLNPSTVSSTLAVGLQGVQNGIGIANQAAADIARAGTEGADLNVADLATSLVELKVGEQLAKASAAVVRSADEMLGSLIDIRV
jgi:hypothetical protein